MGGLGTKVWRRLGQVSVATVLAAVPILQFGTPATDLVTRVTHFTYAWHTSRAELQSLHAQARAADAPYIASLRATKDPLRLAEADRLVSQLDDIQRQIDNLADGPVTRQISMIGVARVRQTRTTSLIPSNTVYAVSVDTMSFSSRTYWSPSTGYAGAITNFASNENGYPAYTGGWSDINYDLKYGASPNWGTDTIGYATEYEFLCSDNGSNCGWKVPDSSLQVYVQPCNARYHTRLWDWGPSADGHTFTVGDAHYDNCEHSCLSDTSTAQSYFSNAIQPWVGRNDIAYGDAFTSPSPCNYWVSGQTDVSWMIG